MRRLLVALAAVCLVALAVPAHANIVGGGSVTGDAGDGNYRDNSYTLGSTVSAAWVRNSQTSYHGGYLNAYVNTANLPDFNGHNTCIQIFIDWDTPDGAFRGHYDGRMIRNCDPNSTRWLDFSDGFVEPDDQCLNAPGLVGECDMPMGRVQFARYVTGTDTLLDSTKECWYRESGHTVSDCLAWTPTCPAGQWACLGYIYQRNGNLVIRDGGCASCPNEKVTRPRL